MGRVYAVVSAKGGVGKTTTTTNLAAALASSGADVAVVDGDLGMANLAGSLGVASGGATLHDVLAGEADLDEATREGPHGMTVVPGSTELDAFARADPEGLRDVLSALREAHDYVLLDTGAGLSNDTVVPLTYVDEVLLVSTTGRDALGDTEKTRQVAERLDVPVAGAVVTRVDPDNPGKETVESTLETTVIASIPRTDVVRDAGDAGEPLTTYAPGSSAAAAYRALAADLTGESVRRDDPEPATDADADGAEATAGTASIEAEATGDDEDIIVAGDHEADGDVADSDGDPVDEADVTDDDASDAGVEPVDADEWDSDDAVEAEPADDEPLVEPVDAAPGGDESADAGDEPADADGAASDDDPLIETAEPLSESEDADGEDAERDGETDAADESATDDAEGDAAGDDEDEGEGEGDDEDDDGDEEEGVYTTSLADEADEEETEERKGLFGRFLG